MTTLLPPPKCLGTPMKVPHKTLMGPGPSNCSPRVLAASALPLLGHLHPEFLQIMDDIKEGIRYVFQTTNTLTLAVSGTGHAAMEAACCNLVERGDVVLSAVNGVWGGRFADMVERQGGVAKTLNKPPGQIFTLTEIEEGLRMHRPKVMFMTHGESSGVTCQPLEGIGSLCHRYNCLLVVDSVAAMGGVPLYMDQWEIDVLYSGGQKVLSCPPGASPISFNDKAWNVVKNRKSKVSSFYLDILWLANYWGCDGQPRKYHHTGPISSMYALREGLAIIAEEGLEASWSRHKAAADTLYSGLRENGIELLVKDPNDRLPTVTGIMVPAGLDWKAVADYAMNKYKVEISGGLGPLAGKIWRVGLMGYNATPDNARLVVKIIAEGIQQSRRTAAKL